MITGRSVIPWALALLLLGQACVSLEGLGGDTHDSRLGELGRVRFTGGGGCNSSTVLALGSTAELGVESSQ